MKRKPKRNAARSRRLSHLEEGTLAAAPAAISYRTSMAAAVIGVCERTVRKLITEGELPSIKVGGVRLIRRSAIEKFLFDREKAS
jgi:excisionase family DNA binding protein